MYNKIQLQIHEFDRQIEEAKRAKQMRALEKGWKF